MISHTSRESDIAIVGAGPVGLLLGILLSQRGFKVDVYEARPDPRNAKSIGGRSINLTLAERGWKAFRAAGIDSEIRAVATPLYGRMIHVGSSPRFQPYTADGDAIYSASRSGLATLLTSLADKSPSLTLHFGHRCCDLDIAERAVRFETPDGDAFVVRPNVLFAADGAYSTVRRLCVRAAQVSHFQRLSPIMYKELLMPRNSDGARALEKNVLHVWPRGNCMTVAFPNLDGSFTFSIFMPAGGELSFGAVTNTQELEEFFRHNCPELESLTAELAPDFFNRPPASLASAACTPWNFGGWVTLIGDSAHALVPFLGQGLNCGLEDCTELMELLDSLGPDWSELLPAFEEVRSVNCSAAIRLAEQHFDELANKARDPLFVTRKALEGKAHRLAPERFIPLYSRVAFGDEPYSVVERARMSQEAVLDRLMLLPDISSRWDDPDVEELLLAELDRIGPRRESNQRVWIARVR